MTCSSSPQRSSHGCCAICSPTDGPVTYLDPDIRVYSSLQRLHELACAHGVVLIPHNTEPLPEDGLRPNQIDILLAGVYNLGFVSLAAGEEIDRLLQWWQARLLSDCRVDPLNGYFVDQRWFDLASGLVADHAIVREPQYNVAYWNVHARRLEHDGERYTVERAAARLLSLQRLRSGSPERPQPPSVKGSRAGTSSARASLSRVRNGDDRGRATSRLSSGPTPTTSSPRGSRSAADCAGSTRSRSNAVRWRARRSPPRATHPSWTGSALPRRRRHPGSTGCTPRCTAPARIFRRPFRT